MIKRKRTVTSEPAVPAENNWFRWVIPLLVAAVTFIVFLPALQNGFVNWDDDNNFLNNYLYRGLGWEQLKWMFTTFHMGHYQPLSWVTLGFDYLVWGMNPFGYHLTNVVLHSVNAALFYIICLKLFQVSACHLSPVTCSLAAGFAALFFSIHPLRAESVVWVTERRDVLSGMFFLLSILCYITPRLAGGESAPFWRRYTLPFALFVLSLLSKAIAITMPAILILIDIYPLRRLTANPLLWPEREFRHIWLEKIPYLVVAAVFAVAAYIAQAEVGALVTYDKLSFSSRAAHILFAGFFYIWKTLVPLNLAPYYKITSGLASWQAFQWGAFIMAIALAAAAFRRRCPALPSALAYFLIVISPVANIIKAYTAPAADRYSYLPCMGFAALAGWVLFRSLGHSSSALKKAVVMLACLGLLVLGRFSWVQAKIWYDSETLWEYTLSINPGIEFARSNLAAFLINEGRTDEAVVQCFEALKINPDYVSAHNNLGVALADQGKNDAAISSYREALRLNPDFIKALNNIGDSFAAQDKLGEAERSYREALRRKPNYADAHNGLGAALARQGNDEEAMAHFQAVLRLNPNHGNARKNIALLLKRKEKK